MASLNRRLPDPEHSGETAKITAITTKRTYRVYEISGILLLIWTVLPGFPFLKNRLNSSPLLSLLYWGAVVAAVCFILPSVPVPGRIRQRGAVRGYAVSGAVLFIALGFILGVALKSLKGSPYDLSPAGLLFNGLTVFPALAARELVRGHCLGTIWRTRKRRYGAAALVTLLLAAAEINWSKAFRLTDAESLVIYIVRDIVPELSENCLMSVLVFYGGPGAGILYEGVLEGFQKTFPFLPDLPWLASGAAGVIFPLIYAMYIGERCRAEQQERRVEREKGRAGYLTALLISVIFSWFCVGVFPVFPSVVLTGSMEPEIRPGDVVLIRKLQEEKEIYGLEEGDVINFKRETINITHRIRTIETDEAGNRSFITKGDNNRSADEEAVLPADIRGIVVSVVPKAGIPVLMLKSREAIPEGVVDYE